MNNQIYNLLGLARRGGKITYGESVLPLLNKSKNILVIIAADASDNTKKKFIDKCNYYHKTYLILGDKESLSNALGMGNVSVLAISEPNLISKILNLSKDGDMYGTKQ